MTSEAVRVPAPTRPDTSGAVLGVRVGALLLLLVVVAAGTLGVVAQLTTHERNSSLTVTGVTQVSADVHLGDVRVTGGPADGRLLVDSHVTWSRVEPVVSVPQSSGAVTVTAACGRGDLVASLLLQDRCGTDISLTAPGGVPVHVASDVGDVRADGVAGPLQVDARVGDVSGSGLASRQVVVAAGTGDVVLRFAQVPDRVSVRGSVGDVTLVLPAGATYRLDVRGSGDHSSAFTSDPSSRHVVEVDAPMGDVSVLRAA